MFLGLRTTAYPTDDLQASKAWFTALLGYEPYFDEPFYVGYEVAGYELALMPAEEGGPQPGAALTYWGVPDAQVALDALVAAGAAVAEPLHEVGGGIRVAGVTEPGGAFFGVIENPLFELKPPVSPGDGPGR